MSKKKSAASDEQEASEGTLSGPSPVNIHRSGGAALPADTDSLKELIEKNIKWSQVIYEQNRKIKRRLTMMVVGDYLRLFFIIAPIILGIIYLPELLHSAFGQYAELLSHPGSGGISPEVLQEAVKLFGAQ